ncbi:hypothetical protein [Rhizobium mesosinicum]|uniref:EamA domain-containing protein n=1 Tax=Rhizobium mesosinicum TaxID=335017 RepID=A0ABS7GM13_9HYPH|nr:hypothetical protein [Rhizobium mesosinicum]MBW9051030.1 hypothetical protein [Rhizobium mesosinicum]
MLILLGVAIALFIGGASASKVYVLTSSLLWLVVALALYCLGNLVMIRLMRDNGLGLAISLSSVAQLVIINVIAVVWFGERLSTAQVAGVALGAVAVTLMLVRAPAA